MINREKALQSLCPEAEWKTIDGNFTWLKGNGHSEPTSSEIDAEIIRLQAEYDAQDYARQREAAYPSTKDFMEAYTEKEIGSDSTKWDAYVIAYNKVRTDNPKP